MDGAFSRTSAAAFVLLCWILALLVSAGTAGAAAGDSPAQPRLAQAANQQAQAAPPAQVVQQTQAVTQGAEEQSAAGGQQFRPADGPPKPSGEAETAPLAPDSTSTEPQLPAAAPQGETAAGQPPQPPRPAVEQSQPLATGKPPQPPAETQGVAEEPSGQGERTQAPGDWEKGALENLYYPDPYTVRVAILNASGRSRQAGMVAFFLEEYSGRKIGEKLGKKISVVNISNMPNLRLRRTEISYRPGNLRAALLMADAIPGKQVVAPMTEEQTGKIGIDVEIRIGRETR